MQRHEEGGACGLATKREEPEGRRPAQPEGRRAGSRSRRGRRRGVALAPLTTDARTADARRSRCRRELQVRSFPFLLSFSLSPNGQIDERAVDFSTWPSISRPPPLFPSRPDLFPARARLWRPPHRNRTPTGHLPTPRRRLGPKADAIRAQARRRGRLVPCGRPDA